MNEPCENPTNPSDDVPSVCEPISSAKLKISSVSQNAVWFCR